MRLLLRSLAIPALAVLWVTTVRAGKVGDYLTKDGKLKHKVELGERILGRGISGQVWTIETTGEWTVAPLQDDMPLKPLRKGKLNEKQLAALANQLAAQDFLTLPKLLKDEAPPNWTLSIRIGNKETALRLGGVPSRLSEVTPPSKSPQATEWSRLVALAVVIDYWTRDTRAKVRKGHK